MRALKNPHNWPEHLRSANAGHLNEERIYTCSYEFTPEEQQRWVHNDFALKAHLTDDEQPFFYILEHLPIARRVQLLQLSLMEAMNPEQDQ